MNYQEIQSGLSVTVQGKHRTFKAMLIDKVPHSHTKVVVMDTERGPGFDARTETYPGFVYRKGVGIIPNKRVAIGENESWGRGQNHGYGDEYTCHIKDLIIN